MRNYLLLAMLAACITTYGQLPPGPVIQSPNTASLGTFGTIPVSYNTGAPDISVPIHTAQGGNIQIPIVLRYHPASVRPNEHPGWVGLGWSLQSAGVISRAVRNRPDEVDNDGAYKNYYDHGRYRLALSDWNSRDKLISYFTYNNNGEILDVEADEFYFNFLGYSGKFFLTSSGWKVIADKDIKVEMNSFIKENIAQRIKHNLPNMGGLEPVYKARMYYQFTLTTEDGTKYTFGGSDAGGEDAVEYSIRYATNINDYTANAWHLIRIVDTNNRTTEFKYHRKYPICSLQFTSGTSDFECSNGTGSWTAQNITTRTHGGVAVFPVYLDEIISPTEKIKFVTSYSTELKYPDNYLRYFEDGVQEVKAEWLRPLNAGGPDYDNLKWEQLDEIQIKDKSDNIISRYAFEYSNSSTQRLTLNALKQKSADNSVNQVHSFSYNNVAALPPYGGDKTDHWGYYNNRSIDGISFVTLQAGSDPNKNKKTNTSVITTGLLTKIVYPTGGYSEFDWEAHAYSKVVATNKAGLDNETGNAGGCRIREIRSYTNSNATPVKKTYYYVLNYAGNPTGLASSGVLNGRPQYHIFISSRPSLLGEHNVTYMMSSVSSTVSYGMNTQGSHIGYKEVIELNSDGSYSKFQYTSYDADIYGVTHYDNQTSTATLGWKPEEDRFIPFSSLERERGKLVRTTHYTNTHQPVKRIDYAYNNDPARFNSNVRTTEHKFSFLCTPADGMVVGAAYLHYTYRYNVISETTVDYNPDLTGTSKIQSYTYNIYGLPSEIRVSQSDGTTRQTIYKYPTDYSNTTYTDACRNTYNSCKAEADRLRMDCYSACGGQSPCISGCESAYTGRLGVCEANYNNCLNAYPTSNAIIELKERHIFSAIIEEQNRVIYPDNSIGLTGGKLTLYRKNGTLLLPSTVSQIETATPLTDLTLSNIQASGSFTSHPAYKTTLFLDVYDDRGNILQYHKADGINQSYLWGYDKNFAIAEITNSRPSEIFSDGFEETTPGWDANLSARDNTRSHSGKYSGKIIKTSAGELYSHSSQWLNVSLSGPTRFKYSGWVYSDGPTAEIYLFMKTSTESSYYTFVDKVFTSTIGKWVYLEKEFQVPANITKLNIRVDNNGGGTVWFDDVRLHPSNARMTTYTYDPVKGLTSKSDANNITTYFEYDQFNRLKVIRDQDNKILKHFQYHYQGQY